MSELLKELCKLLKIKKLSTSSHHPQTNSNCERMNSVINATLRAYTNDDQSNWADLIPSIMMAYRVAPCEATGFSPYFLLSPLYNSGPTLKYILGIHPLSSSKCLDVIEILKKCICCTSAACHHISCLSVWPPTAPPPA